MWRRKQASYTRNPKEVSRKKTMYLRAESLSQRPQLPSRWKCGWVGASRSFTVVVGVKLLFQTTRVQAGKKVLKARNLHKSK